MPVVPSTPRPSVRLQQQAASTSEFRRSDTSAAFGAVGASALASSGKFMSELAKDETKQLENQERVRFTSELAEFNVATTQRVNELANSDLEDRTLVEATMEDFEGRANTLIEAQPNFLKADAKLKTLPIQVQAAKSAIAVQSQRDQQERTQAANTLSNSLSNEITVGQTSLDTAFAKIDEFTNALPPGEQEAQKQQLRQNALFFALQREAEEGLRENGTKGLQDVIKRIDDGEFNELDARKLSALRSSYLKKFAEGPQKAAKLQRQAVAKIDSDPISAADKILQSQGFPEGTAFQDAEARDQAYQALGVPERRRFGISKDQANAITTNLLASQNQDDFFENRDTVLEQFERSGVTREKLTQDIQGLTEGPFSLRMLMGLQRGEASSSVIGSLLEITKNPSAGAEAREAITENSIAAGFESADKEDFNKALLENVVTNVIGPQSDIAVRAGVPKGKVRAQEETLRDAVFVVAADIVRRDPSGSLNDPEGVAESVAEQINEIFGGAEVRNEFGIDAYSLEPHLAEAISEEQMTSIRHSFILDPRLREQIDFPRVFQQLGFGQTPSDEELSGRRETEEALQSGGIGFSAGSINLSKIPNPRVSLAFRLFEEATGWVVAPDGGVQLAVQTEGGATVPMNRIVGQDENGNDITEPIVLTNDTLNEIAAIALPRDADGNVIEPDFTFEQLRVLENGPGRQKRRGVLDSFVIEKMGFKK